MFEIKCCKLFLASIDVGIFSLPAQAQIIPDRTLGSQNSQVIRGTRRDRIVGGARRGSTLFHSFREFNVRRGRGVYFTNPRGVTNIFNRVTGNNLSRINGTLGVLGNANLFLINPNGIIFGKGAKLDLNGSFFGTTASNLIFKNGFQFSATNPQNVPITFTTNFPVGFGFGFNGNRGTITVKGKGHNLRVAPFAPVSEEVISSGLEVDSEHTLALIGGNISLNEGVLRAPNGHIKLASVSNSTVNVTPNNSGFDFKYDSTSSFKDIQLSNVSLIDTSSSTPGIASGTINWLFQFGYAKSTLKVERQ